jgi:SAM-dependent methyltransferase
LNEPCDLCGGDSFASYARGMYALGGALHDLVRCRRCTLVQVRPLPDDAAIRSMYGDDYFEKDYDSCLSEASYFESFPRLMARYGALLDAIDALAPRGSLFEVGCAGGYFLALARDRGWRVRGLEITAAGTTHARDELALEVTRGAFPSPVAGAPFDVVYMGHVLEHLRSPAAGIDAVGALLRPGGLLVVEVPTYVDSPYFRALRLALPVLRAAGLDRGGLLRALKFPVPGQTMEPFHLYEFRRRTLVRLLERFGYRVLRTESRVPKPDGVAKGRDAASRAIGAAFGLLDWSALRLGLPGGNIAAFARRSES